ncbi:hypothetical protein ACFL49_03605, partial [Candidatus Omnitrophota bacterium]
LGSLQAIHDKAEEGEEGNTIRNGVEWIWDYFRREANDLHLKEGQIKGRVLLTALAAAARYDEGFRHKLLSFWGIMFSPKDAQDTEIIDRVKVEGLWRKMSDELKGEWSKKWVNLNEQGKSTEDIIEDIILEGPSSVFWPVIEPITGFFSEEFKGLEDGVVENVMKSLVEAFPDEIESFNNNKDIERLFVKTILLDNFTVSGYSGLF